MQLHLEWERHLSLEDARKQNGIYSVKEESVPEEPGIYVFLRAHGNSKEALYIGKAKNLRSRVRQQLNNVRLMMGIKNAMAGRRKLLVGVFAAKPGQQEGKCLKLMERALIRHYLSLGNQILNIQGTRIVRDSLKSTRTDYKRFIPADLYFEKA